MTQIRMHAGDLVIMEGTHYKVLSRDGHGVVLRTLGPQPVSLTKTHAELAELYFGTPRKLFLVLTIESGLPSGIVENLKRQLESFDVRSQDEALRRLDYVQAFDRAHGRKEASCTIEGFAAVARATALERRRLAADSDGVEPERLGLEKIGGSTLRAWYWRWRKAGRNIVALVPLHDRKGRAGQQLAREVHDAIADRINQDWLTLERLPLSHVCQFIAEDVKALNVGRENPLDVPSEATVRRWVARNVAKYDEVYHREGHAAAEELFRHVRPAPEARRPLEVVEVDHTPLDVLVVDDEPLAATVGTECEAPPSGTKRETRKKRTKRVWLTVAICAATRMIVGFHISEMKPSWTSVMHCLRMAILPKDLSKVRVLTPWPVYGVMEVLKLDNGPEFHSRSMKAAASQLRIELRYMPRRRPHLKGKVERFLGTVARDFCAYLVGRTFRDVRERGGYPSEERAAYVTSFLIEQFTIWVVDVYHNEKYGGLLGRRPLQRWEDLSGYGVRLPPSADDLVSLLALVVPRSIQRHGITFLGLRYQSDALKEVRRRPGYRIADTFLVKVDPADMSRLLVLVTDEGEWIEVPCTQPRLAQGMTLAGWRQTVTLARNLTTEGDRVAERTLLRARQMLRENARAAGARYIPPSNTDLDWFREHVDDPFFDVSADPSPEPGAEPAARPSPEAMPTRRDVVESALAASPNRHGGASQAVVDATADDGTVEDALDWTVE